MKTQKSNTITANVTPKSNKSENLAVAMAEAISKDLAQESGKAAKKEPTPEEKALKELKARLSNSKRILNDTLIGYRKDHCDLKSHLKAFKKSLPSEYADKVQAVWTALTIECKKAGNCYLEEVVIENDGKKQKLVSVHMCEWQDAAKTLEICRKITVIGYRYGKEDMTEISSLKELTIERKFTTDEYVSLGVINGVENFKKVTKTTTKRMRPVEVETLSDKEFQTRMRKAWAVIFADGIEKVTNK